MVHRPKVPLPVASMIYGLIAYHWQAEKRDFLAHHPEPTLADVTDRLREKALPGKHIFVFMVRLERWLNGEDWGPEATLAALQEEARDAIET